MTASSYPEDECLSNRGERLFIEECDTVELLETYGSPLFVMSEHQLRSNFRRYKNAFGQHWPDGPLDVLPANKANWNTAVLSVLSQEGAGVDTYSEGELFSALKCNVNPERISVNGGGKSDVMLHSCIEAGVRITVEDIDEPERINRIAASLNKVAKIRFRVKPDFPNLWKKDNFLAESVSIDMCLQLYKSGIPAQYLEALGHQVFKMDHVELVGLHFHCGRHHNSLWFWRGVMRRYAKLVVHLCKAWGGYKPQELDIGGGFPSPRDPHSKSGIREDTLLTWFIYPLELMLYGLSVSGRYSAWSTLIEKALVKVPGQMRPHSIEDYAEAAVTSFRDSLLEGGMDLSGVRLQIEPGRGFYGNTGIHLTKVKKFKQQSLPVKMNWVLTDTTYFFLTGGVYEHSLHEFRVANKVNHPPKHVADVVGHSCYADRILPLVRVPDIEEGDVIALLETGAYQEVSASNFNALPRPAVVLVNGDQADVIKVAETIDDVYARDRIPERLTRVSEMAEEPSQ
jgi:diaminopimelate decarboxylase